MHIHLNYLYVSLLFTIVFYSVAGGLLTFFFVYALSRKNKNALLEKKLDNEKRRLENEIQEFEKQVAVLEARQEERNRISADMHDELGSGLTAIRLMSEILKSKMKANAPPEVEKISVSANDLLNKMNMIIWTIVSANDTVESLFAYIRNHALEYFENTGIECRFSMPVQMASQSLNGEKRRNIFLCVREALHNVVKHAKASVVFIDMKVNHQLIIVISDNGIGIKPEHSRPFANGLKNIRKRMEAIQGNLLIENETGTRLLLQVAL